MNKYGDLRTGRLCPNCLKDIADCCVDNGGWNRCKTRKAPLLICPDCFTDVNLCKCGRKKKDEK